MSNAAPLRCLRAGVGAGGGALGLQHLVQTVVQALVAVTHPVLHFLKQSCVYCIVPQKVPSEGS